MLVYFAIFSMQKTPKYAILSFSGGLDSTSLLINLLYNNFNVQCISFDYGQNHLVEIEKAELNIKYLRDNGFAHRLEHKIVNIKDAFNSTGSSLFKNSEKVPTGHYEDSSMLSTLLPSTDTIMSFFFKPALSAGLSTNTSSIFAGVKSFPTNI